MKNILLTAFFGMLSYGVKAQSPTYFHGTYPGWSFKQVVLPADLLEEYSYPEGIKEVRFAPGMFDPSSDSYFSYIFLFTSPSSNMLTVQEIEQMLLTYYKGWNTMIGYKNGVLIQEEDIQVNLNGNDRELEGSIDIINGLGKGHQIQLYLELSAYKTQDGTYRLLGLVSPKDKKAKVWEALYEQRDQMSL
ncbi:hypothetical protein [Algivirga pacifica]|uniref:Uncharacterized protein n=1 Tax=Algivirga pacifica TaxID=1162670 RepID=A0ABP9CW38_9BACT